MLRSLDVPIQILSTSNIIKAENWKSKISNPDYYNFISEKIQKDEITVKEFSIIINDNNEVKINNAFSTIKRGLKGCNLEYSEVVTLDKPQYIPDKMRTDYIVYDNVYYKTIYINNWPYCTDWLNEIFNNDMDIDSSMFISPVDQVDAKKYLDRKLTQNAANAGIEIEDNGEFNAEQYDQNIISASRMRNEIFKNTGKLYFISNYITIKGKSLKELNERTYMIKRILDSIGVETYSCLLRQDDGYKCTRPIGIDYLGKKYNMTTGSLKYLFPFITSNVIDENGVLVGDNLLNGSLVFLDLFKYSCPLMFMLGQMGSGKSYLTKTLAKRMADMGIKVDIWDQNGEYAVIEEHKNITIHRHETIEEYENDIRQYCIDMENNLAILQPRVLFIDELWKYLKNQYISARIQYMAREGRKHYQGLVVATHMVDDLLKSEYADIILKQASIKVLLRMEVLPAKMVQRVLDLPDEEKNFIISAQNEGILMAGTTHIQFKAITSIEEHNIITTDPRQRVELMKNLEEAI